MKFDPENLEVKIYPANTKGGRARQRKWMVCEKGKAPLKSGSVTGAYSKAQQAGMLAMEQLIAEATKKKKIKKK